MTSVARSMPRQSRFVRRSSASSASTTAISPARRRSRRSTPATSACNGRARPARPRGAITETGMMAIVSGDDSADNCPGVAAGPSPCYTGHDAPQQGCREVQAMREARQMNAPEPTIETAPAAEQHSAGAPRQRPPWLWIPTLYFAEGLPNAIVVTVSLVMYKDLGLSNTANTFWTRLLYLAWVVKPLWSPFVDILGTRRRWTWVTQLLMAVALAGVAMRVPMPDMLPWTLAFFWLIAFTSATHDIAADGFYMLALDPSRQALYVGIRTLFYRLSAMFASGLFLLWAGRMIEHSGGPAAGWSVAIGGLAGIMGVLGVWHALSLPKPVSDHPSDARRVGEMLREFGATFTTFFQKPGIGR